MLPYRRRSRRSPIFRRRRSAAPVRLSGLKKLTGEKGGDRLCGENSSGLSGGERQRIRSARALLRKIPVLFAYRATAPPDAILKPDSCTRVTVTRDPRPIDIRVLNLYNLTVGKQRILPRRGRGTTDRKGIDT